MPAATRCPGRPEYERLAQGLLLFDAAEQILEHLETCSHCQEIIGTLGDHDPFTQCVRVADDRADPSREPAVASLMRRLRGLSPLAAGIGLEETPVPDSSWKSAPREDSADRATDTEKHEPSLGEDESTLPWPASRESPDHSRQSLTHEVYDFLRPPQGPGEIGWLGNYRVIRVLGVGGMGVVFEAEDLVLKRRVALKAMRPSVARSPTAGSRFLREAQATAALKHDHIVTIYQVGEEAHVPYMAMELLQGESLDKRLERDGKLSLADVLRLGQEMARGLSAAHKNGLIHRDIKPANIWLETVDDGAREAHSRPAARVKILDFGLARVGGETRLSGLGAIIGTPEYMAPEQATGQPIDPRCDLFSLGCVLYRATAGRPAFQGKDAIAALVAVSVHAPLAPKQIDPELSGPLSDLIMKLLAKDPNERPASAQEVLEAILAIERNPAPVEKQLSPSQPNPDAPAVPVPRSSSRWAVGAVLTLLAALVASAVFIIRVPAPEGEFRVEVSDDSVAVAVDKQGGLKLIDRKLGKEYAVQARKSRRLPVGEYDVVVREPEGLKVSGQTVTIKAKEAPASVRVSFKSKPPDTVAPPHELKGDFALRFDKTAESRVWVRGLRAGGLTELTLEAYVTLDPGEDRFGADLLGWAGVFRLRFHQQQYTIELHQVSGMAGPVDLPTPMRRVHVAVVRARTETVLFIDGKKVARQEGDAQPLGERMVPLTFGNDQISGIIDEVRISNVARYRQDFPPPGRFKADPNTLALFHCDEGEGAELKDSSSRACHGQITGAKWVKVKDR